ncbi:MAG: 1-deoxy-D-xylulose-5-phosphate synthase [Limnochordia bacterium]|jgi:1-deoxy-D-xylulose-5-phosphate synthase|nr:1-deoxy-D-xylulose-5-phosphate synthase [Bacillota bacterium]NLL07498.1 1-deoxy-D-xylulose-5-phosphate synthase [Bacillota bacterium]
MSEELLARIKSPEDIKKLDLPSLELLASEIRHRIVSTVEENGGHLGANLGVVELTLALHSVLSTPRDKIIWDVGHQCYTHKLITGRQDRFHTLRQWGGLSGFPLPAESEHDHFGVGHSSTSVSAAAGMVIARDLQGEDFNVVAVIGDGALTGGMAFEGLNHIGSLGKDIIVILNDNEMSITNNVGALSDYLGRIRSHSFLYQAREGLAAILRGIPLVGPPLAKLAHKVKITLKHMLPGQFFEELGFAYLGPFDGHNIAELQRAIRAGIQRRGPVLIHVYTQKGRGHALAEESPHRYHGVGPSRGSAEKNGPSFSQVFGESLVKLAERNSRIVAITAAMRDGTGLGPFAKAFPERFFDVGIAEQHAVTLAAGMAKEGLRPVVAIYSTFLQRGYDQLIHDVALQGLPVVFAVDRAGVVGDDGATHQGIFDMAFLRPIPGLTILAPRDGSELAAMLAWALQQPGPVAIRYARACAGSIAPRAAFQPAQPIPPEEVKSGRDGVVFAFGPMVDVALEAARSLEPELSFSVINVRTLKPLDAASIQGAVRGKKYVATVEDHVLAGGFGSSILEMLQEVVGGEPRFKVERIGYPDCFIPHGSIARIHEEYGLTARQVAETLRKAAGHKLQVVVSRDS